MITTNTLGLRETLSPIFQTVNPVAVIEKIENITLPYFKSLASFYLGVFGTLEIKQCVQKKNPENITRLEYRTLSASKAYLNLHGALLVGSGIFSMVDALHEFGLLGLSRTAEIISIAGSVLFLGANIIALEENVRLFNEIVNTDWSTRNVDAKELDLLKLSTFWGILSNIGYIAATASLLFSGATTITLVLGALSCFAGGVKIIYDLLDWKRNIA